MVPGSHVTLDPEGFLRRTAGSNDLVRYPEGHTVYAEGDPADSVFYITKGSVSASVLSKHGKQAIVSLLKDGSFFGEECVVGKMNRTATVVCVLPCAMIRVEKPTMVRLLRDDPAFAIYLIEYLVDRATVAERNLITHLFNSSEKRLAQILVRLATSEKDGRLHPIIPKLSQEKLAMMVGTTRSRVNFFMNRFRQLGLIDYNGQIEVREGLLDVARDVYVEEPPLRSQKF